MPGRRIRKPPGAADLRAWRRCQWAVPDPWTGLRQSPWALASSGRLPREFRDLKHVLHLRDVLLVEIRRHSPHFFPPRLEMWWSSRIRIVSLPAVKRKLVPKGQHRYSEVNGPDPEYAQQFCIQMAFRIASGSQRPSRENSNSIRSARPGPGSDSGFNCGMHLPGRLEVGVQTEGSSEALERQLDLSQSVVADAHVVRRSRLFPI